MVEDLVIDTELLCLIATYLILLHHLPTLSILSSLLFNSIVSIVSEKTNLQVVSAYEYFLIIIQIFLILICIFALGAGTMARSSHTFTFFLSHHIFLV